MLHLRHYYRSSIYDDDYLICYMRAMRGGDARFSHEAIVD